VGNSLLPKRFRGAALATLIGGLLDDAAVASRCRDVAARLAENDGLARACDEVEAAWHEHASSASGA
jgi:hypothetical protein